MEQRSGRDVKEYQDAIDHLQVGECCAIGKSDQKVIFSILTFLKCNDPYSGNRECTVYVATSIVSTVATALVLT